MKKMIYISMIVFFALGMFSACKQDNDPDDQNLSAYVTATVHGQTGVIRVAWVPVANAVGYEVYRKSVAPDRSTTVKVMRVINSPLAEASYYGFDDVIAFNNEFHTDVMYTYRVMARANWSGSTAGGALWETVPDTEWNLIQNSSKDSNTVSFPATGKNALLAQGSRLAAPENLTLSKAYRYGTAAPYTRTDFVQATWKAERGVQYIVSYGIPGSSLASSSYTTVFQSMVNINEDQTTAVVDIPLFFGDIAVEVIAHHKTQAGAVYYYLDSEPANEVLQSASVVIPPPVVTAYEAAGNVTINWDIAANVPAYKVYRFTGVGANYDSAAVFVYDNWEDISAAAEPVKGATKWTAVDSAVTAAPGVTVLYMVIGVSGDAVSLPATAAVETGDYVMPALSGSALGWDGLAEDYQGILLNWIPRAGETYRLHRAALNWQSAGGVTGPEGGVWNWEEVSLAGINAVQDGSHGLIDKPAYRRSWRYRLEAYDSAGNRKGSSFAADVVDIPYRYNTVPVLLSVNSSPGMNAPYYTGIAITSSAAQLKKLMFSNETVRISRAPTLVNGTEFGPYVTALSIPYSNLNNNEQLDHPGPGYFKYKAEIVNDSHTVTALNGAASPVCIPASNPTGLRKAASALPSDPDPMAVVYSANTYFQIMGANAFDRLNGTQLIVRYAGSTAGTADALSMLNSGFCTVKELTLNWMPGGGNDYATGTISTPYTNEAFQTLYWAAKVYYKHGGFLPGFDYTVVDGLLNEVYLVKTFTW